MKSVLLGGLKVWLVNDGGKPLSAPGGRARFFNAETSLPETVYSDIDLTQSDALGTVVYTDELGYLPAIWLKTDRLYKVRVEQKIPGSGNQWALLWEVDNVGYIDPHESENPGDTPVFVTDISALKDVDFSAHSVVYVLGYYAPGDWGEPSIFEWDPDCSKVPDDGAYVLPNDRQQAQSGRWVQVFDGAMLDVRKFGAIPDLAEHPDVTSQVVNAVHFSQDNSTRVRPLTVAFLAPGKYGFSGNFDFSYFTFTDISSEMNDIYPVEWFVGNDVVFKNITSISAVYTLSKNTEIFADKELVEGLVSLHVEGGGKIEVDPAWWGSRNCVLEDCYVKCRSVSTNFKDFTRCAVESNGMMGGEVSLTSMGFKESWLTPSFDLGNLSLVDVNYDVHDCRSGDSYIAIKNGQNDPDYGDMFGSYVSNAPMLAGNVTLKNAKGSITVSASGYTNLDLDGFEGTVTTPSEPSSTQPRFYAKNCDIIFAGGNDYAQLRLRRCSTSGTAVKVVGNALVDYCDMGSALMCHGDLTIRNSTVGGNVTHTCAGTLNLVFTDNVLNALLNIGGTTPGTLVNAIITGNTSGVPNPIAVDRTNLDLVDSHHGYTYSGNSGTFLPDVTSPVTFTVGVRYYVNLGSPTPPRYREAYRTLQRPITGNFIKMWNNATFFDNVQFFRIGTDRFHVLAKLVGWDGRFVDDPYVSYCDINVGAYHIDGMTWGIKPFWTDPSLSEDDLESVFNTAFFRGVEQHGIEDDPPDYDREISIVYENLEKHQ